MWLMKEGDVSNITAEFLAHITRQVVLFTDRGNQLWAGTVLEFTFGYAGFEVVLKYLRGDVKEADGLGGGNWPG